MKKFAIALASLAAVAGIAAPNANAFTGYNAATVVTWPGGGCINVTGGYSGVRKQVCGRSYTLTESNVQVGDQIGVEADAFLATCTLTYKGAFAWSDTSVGTDPNVDCRRTAQ